MIVNQLLWISVFLSCCVRLRCSEVNSTDTNVVFVSSTCMFGCEHVYFPTWFYFALFALFTLIVVTTAWMFRLFCCKKYFEIV